MKECARRGDQSWLSLASQAASLRTQLPRHVGIQLENSETGRLTFYNSSAHLCPNSTLWPPTLYCYKMVCFHDRLYDSFFVKWPKCSEIETIEPIKAPNTTIAEFANTIGPEEMAHNEPSHLDLPCLPYSPYIFNRIQFEMFFFF